MKPTDILFAIVAISFILFTIISSVKINELENNVKESISQTKDAVELAKGFQQQRDSIYTEYLKCQTQNK